jgi:chromosome condensin MukBEF ATPase and DNA-binding subunit MukB
MDTTALWFAIGTGAVASAAAGVAGGWWWQSRHAKSLHAKLEKSEQARTAAVERSRQARAQVAQLQQALAAAKGHPDDRSTVGAEPLEAHTPTADDAQQRRARLSRQLDETPLLRPRHEVASHGFADTVPVE